MIDSHVHLHDSAYDADRQAVLDRARQAGLTAMITVGTDLKSSVAALELAIAEPDVYATVGFDPAAATRGVPMSDIASLTDLAKHPRVVAIGEVGFDFYRTSPSDFAETETRQVKVLLAMKELAEKVSKPLVLHLRSHPNKNAFELGLHYLDTARVPLIAHCFDGGRTIGHQFLAKKITLSLAGNITYSGPNTKELFEMVEEGSQKALFLNSCLVETDGPFLAPIPHRGQRNEPAFLVDTVAALASQIGLSPSSLDQFTTKTARRLFQI